jgi:hypothetical protein
MIYKNVELHNIHELLDDETGEGKTCCRIPNDLRLTLNDSAKNNALQATGGEIRFNRTGERVVITLLNTNPDQPSMVEVYQGDFLKSIHAIGPTPTEVVIEKPEFLDLIHEVTAPGDLLFDTDLIRVVLPWRPPVKLISIEGETTPPRPDQSPPLKYLAYGSSITHGNTTIRPTGTYPFRTAQLLGTDLFNMGFGGGAHMEAGMADYLAGRTDWDVATLEMGINVVGSFEVETFKAKIDYFVTTIAEKHPDKWIFCIDIFPCRHDFLGNKKAGTFRSIVKEQVQRLNMPKLVHVPGGDILTSITGLTTDLVHPSPLGFEEMARNLSAIMQARLG